MKSPEFVAGVIALPLAIGIAVAAWIWRAYVLVLLWAWFMVPLFNAPAMSLPYAIGAIGVFSVLKGVTLSKNAPGMGKTLSAMFLSPAVTLAMAWIATRFI